MLNTAQKTIRTSLFYLFTALFFLPEQAHAYVDPGSGSVIITTVLGFIAAIGYTFRKVFYDLRAKYFGGKNPENDRSLNDQ